MILRCVVSEAKVAGIAVNFPGAPPVTTYGQTVPGARYKIVDEDGREVSNIKSIELATPFGGEDDALYATVEILVPIEVEK